MNSTRAFYPDVSSGLVPKIHIVRSQVVSLSARGTLSATTGE